MLRACTILAMALLGLGLAIADIAPVISWNVETNTIQPSLRGRKDLYAKGAGHEG